MLPEFMIIIHGGRASKLPFIVIARSPRMACETADNVLFCNNNLVFNVTCGAKKDQTFILDSYGSMSRI